MNPNGMVYLSYSRIIRNLWGCHDQPAFVTKKLAEFPSANIRIWFQSIATQLFPSIYPDGDCLRHLDWNRCRWGNIGRYAFLWGIEGLEKNPFYWDGSFGSHWIKVRFIGQKEG